MVKKLLDKTYSLVLAVAWNLLLIYLVYQVTRLEYYLENANYLHYTSEVFGVDWFSTLPPFSTPTRSTSC